jgi:cellulose synthase/poly-beta-1,6-N-acetylglucosamine synthase-like glycosyltransferase
MKYYFSIIIPTRQIDSNVIACLEGLKKIKYENKEVILLPDKEESAKGDWPFDLKIIATGQILPSEKRNLGVKEAKGDIMAFLDADACPFEDWIEKSIEYLHMERVGALGGPNLTHPDDTVMQKASGDIIRNPIAWGHCAIRNRVVERFGMGLPVKELPSCNLFVKKEVIEKIGGFDTSLLTGEDAKLCFQIRGLGKKVVYAPDIKVYHHRRKLFIPHLEQTFIYGRDKMIVMKSHFSMDKLSYFVPLLFVLFVFFGALSAVLFEKTRVLYFSAMFWYFMVIFIGSVFQSYKRCLLVFPGIFLTHLAYGVGSISGLIRREQSR